MKNAKLAQEAYDKLSEKYAERYVQYKDWQLEERKRFLSLLDESFSKPITILDAGCGHGRDLGLFSSLGYIAVGVDVSPKMLELCPRASVVFCSDIVKMPFIDDYFNGIWSCQCLPNMSKKESAKFISEAYRTMKRNGILFVSTVAGEGEFYEDIGGVGTVIRSYYTLPELGTLLTSHGFSLIQSQGISTPWHSWENEDVDRHYSTCYARKV